MKLLIADDEEFTRDNLTNYIDWESYGIQVIGSAGDGQEAWDIIQEKEPDCLITDIRMPLMDGLELLRKINESGRKIDTIILSGYDEFEYARTALNLGAGKYFLKPVDPSELLSAVINFRNGRIQKQRRDERSSLEDFIRNSVYMTYTPEMFDEAQERFAAYQDYAHAALLLLMEDVSGALQVGRTSVWSSLMDSLGTFCEQTEGCFLPERNTGRITMVFFRETAESVNEIREQACRSITRLLDDAGYQDYVIGNSRINTGTGQLGRSCMEANMAVNQKYLHTGKKIYYLREDISVPRDFDLMITNLVEKTVYYDEEEVDRLVDFLFEYARIKAISGRELKRYVMEAVSGILAHETMINIDLQKLYMDPGMILHAMKNAQDQEELRRKLHSFVHTVGRTLNRASVKSPNQTVLKIKEYIMGHYADPKLSLSRIAEEFSFSPAYLSSLFSREDDQRLTDFINEVRIGEACRMLRETDMKVAEVSERAGYANLTYFYKVFKRLKGCSPGDYGEAGR